MARLLQQTLAGRSRAAIEALGRSLGCDTRCIALEALELPRLLEPFACALSAAGPLQPSAASRSTPV